jgi:hypothetical protein
MGCLGESAHDVRWMRSRQVTRAGARLVSAMLLAGAAVAFAWLRLGPPESRTSALLGAAPQAAFEAGGFTGHSPRGAGRTGKSRQPAVVGASAAARSSSPDGSGWGPSAEVPAAGVTVSGHVLDALGGPVVGATVLARVSANEPPLASAISRQRGEFVLAVPSGPLQVEAHADAYSIALANVVGPARDISLVMAPSASIIGQVVASDTGAGVADVLVTASNASGVRMPPVSVTSGENGFFRIENVPGGGYSLNAASARHGGGPLWVAVAVGQASDAVRLVVAPATRLTARVSVSGEPCRGGQVVLSGITRAFGRFDAGGVAFIDGVAPGSYRLLAVCRGALTRSEQVVVGNEPVERIWDLDPGLSLSGSVLDADGRAVAGAEVQVTSVAAVEASTGTAAAVRCASDEAGELSCVGLAPGVVEARVTRGGRVLGKPATVELVRGRSASVVLRLDPAGSIRASFAGSTAPASPVYVRGEDGRAILGRVAEDVAWFEGLPLGHYEVYAGQPGVARAVGVALVEQGQVADVRLTAPRLRSIVGRVLDEAGAPVVDAWVRAESMDRASGVTTRAGHSVLTDGSGSFELAALPPGEYALTASNARGEGRGLRISAGATGVTLAFETYGRLIGSVTTDAGERPAAFVVSYVRAGGPGGRVSGKDGHWLLPWAPPGEYRLTITTETGEARADAVLPAGGEANVLSVTASAPR